MNGTIGPENVIATGTRRKINNQILLTLVAVGGACGLASAPVSALELGEIAIDSTLGQPLRARIAYALQPNEQIFEYCIFLNPGAAANGIPGVGEPLIALTNRAILLLGRSPVREPLLALRLSVNCPSSPIIAKDYILMIDPALPTDGGQATLMADGPPVAEHSPVTDSAVDSRPGRTQAVAAQTRMQDDSPIAIGDRYRVQSGDSLSEITSRIENRSLALWPAVDVIFAANPDAFLNNDRDLLMAGAWLVIPELADVRTVAATPGTDAIPPVTTIENVASPNAYAGVAVPQPESVPAQIEAPVPAAATEAVTVEETDTPVVLPGDVVVSTENPFVVPVETADVVDIPFTVIQAPPIAQPVPVVTVKDNPGTTRTGNTSSWLKWLGSAGLALLLGMFVFGRQLRNRFGSAAINGPVVPSRRRAQKSDSHAVVADVESDSHAVVADVESDSHAVVADVDFDFDKVALNSQPVALDADLDAGTGLQDAGLSDVALSDDSIPPDFTKSVRLEIDTILDSEILATDFKGDEDRDPTVIVDAESFVSEYNDATATALPVHRLGTDDALEPPSGVAIGCEIPEHGDDVESAAALMLTDEIEEAVHDSDQQNSKVASATAEMPAPQDAADTAETVMQLSASMDDENSAAATTEMPVRDDTEETAKISANLPALLYVENAYYDIGDVTIEVNSKRIVTKMLKAS